jgi:hypothetical protein
MKHQYFGDVNDYVKYGLLRAFAAAGFSLGICWMLTPDDGGPDGRKIGYLSSPARWRRHDPALFDALSSALGRPEGRHVRHAECAAVLPNARFFGEPVPDGMYERSAWLQRAASALADSDLAFFDPDNGIEVRSKPRGRSGSSKYLYWDEMEAIWRRGSSLLVFQHFARISREHYIRGLAQALGERAAGASVVPIRTSHVLFLLALQKHHRSRADQALGLLRQGWAGRVAIASAVT